MNKTFGATKNPLQRFYTHAITILRVLEIPEIPGFGGTPRIENTVNSRIWGHRKIVKYWGPCFGASEERVEEKWRQELCKKKFSGN